MTLQHPAVRQLIQMGLVYLAILALTNELHWGSNAMFLFGATWIGQAIVTIWVRPRDLVSGPTTIAEPPQ